MQGGTIHGSLNLPAQSLYYSLPTVYDLCDAANINTVIWYCGMCYWNYNFSKLKRHC
jgi:arsenical-resistance protein 2